MRLDGIGVHTGADVSVLIEPADEGITFRRAGVKGAVRASWRNVAATRLATVLEGRGVRVQTVEHLMSAFSALGIWRAAVTLEGPEIPIMDGSAKPFFDALAPHVAEGPPPEPLTVVAPVRVKEKDAFAALLPHEGRRFDVEIDFDAPVIGLQRVAIDLTAQTFASDIAPARTFGPLADVEKMRRKGFARGASFDNAIAVDGDRVANPGGLRMADEFVRHKLLDAVGDLALAERPIHGLYRSYKGGHRLNYKLLAALFAKPGNFKIVA